MRRSIGLPLALGIVLAILVLALAVGWQILVVGASRSGAEGLRPFDWALLILGTLFFVLVLAGLVWLSAWLIREMRLNQRQRAFLDAVTHEMKTPLASLRLYLDTLRARTPPPERQREFLGHMGEDVDRLQRTVELVLAAARAEHGAARPPRRPVDLGVLLDRCIDDVRARHELPDGAVRLDCATEAPVVLGDADEFGLVFDNLLDNAVHYSTAPVEIHVSVSRSANRVTVEIADRGIGIPRGELRKIFRRFYRAGRDVQRKAAGLGLGLFIVRSLLLRHGGRVVARSEGLGRGSRFAVTLPAAPAAVVSSPRAMEAHAAHPGR